MKRTLLTTLILAAATTASAVDYRIRHDTQYPDQPMRDIRLLQGANASLVWDLRENGTSVGNAATNYYVDLKIASTPTSAAFISTNSAYGTSAGTCAMALTPAQTDTNGVFWYTALVKDASGNMYYGGTGTCYIAETTATGSGGSVVLTTQLNLGSYTITGTLPLSNLPSGVSTNLLGLLDTPSSYAGQSGKTLVVNTNESGVTFSDAGAGDMTRAVYDTDSDNVVDNAEALKGNTNTPLYTVDITLDTAPVLGGDLNSDGHEILMGVNGLDQSRRLGFKVNDGLAITTQYIDRTTEDGIRINGAAPLYPDGDGSGLSGVVTTESDPTLTDDAAVTFGSAGSPAVISYYQTSVGTGIVSYAGASDTYNYQGAKISNIADPTTGDDVMDRAYADARYLVEANNLSDLTDAATARSNLGLVIGTDVLAPDGDGSALTGIFSIQRTPIELTPAATVTVSEAWTTNWMRLALDQDTTLTTSGVDTNDSAIWKLDVLMGSYSLSFAATITNLTTASLLTLTNQYQTLVGSRPYRQTVTEVW